MVLMVTLLLRLAICIAIGGNSIHKKKAAIKQQRLIREKISLIFVAPFLFLKALLFSSLVTPFCGYLRYHQVCNHKS